MMVFSTTVVFAQKDKGKGASAQAYEHADDNAIFNRVTDWFATIGKSEEEKQAILAERKAKRAAKRAEKEAQKKAKEAEEKAKEAKEKAEKGRKDMQKKMKMGR